ncbi:hypothetical protein TanjilG_16423 [Lupinus angustifolius]|uniref:Uncharacterized protein n=1 Tax=Lupinus angustifolius TaxID=3871 RepID=A0A1J7HQY9_LUPAN|nr:hypothetical protein TanjilG_16423 [Lupinus angustifolius]
MNSRSGRAPVRSYRRRKTFLDIDLNHLPFGENREQEEGTSNQLGIEQVQELQVHEQPPTIDVDAFDDDVIESTPRAFAEAKNKNSSRRSRRRTIVDLDLEDQIRVTNSNCNKRNRVTPGQPIFNYDHYDLCISSEGNSSHKRKNMAPPEAPKEPVFNCPICIGPLVEEKEDYCKRAYTGVPPIS